MDTWRAGQMTRSKIENSPGRFITFEGGEGVGKSTQIRLLADRLSTMGHKVVISREPGGTAGAEAVRHVILEAGAGEPFGPQMEAMLFAAARNDHVNQVIQPALTRGAFVLVDRFIDSTRVYQGMSSQLDTQFIASLERVAIDGVMPHLTILLDLDPQSGLTRAQSRRVESEDADRFEKEALDVHAKRRDAFRVLAKSEPDRIKLVDARGPQGTVASRVWGAVASSKAIAAYLNAQTSSKSLETN